MAHWGTSSESGILRKNKPKDNHEDLLVFGYACKLFRDDEKALYIDKGKHLIPWMGDEKLKIDRYDCRGAISDVATFEASREGYDAMRWLGLNESDRKIEQLCDKERYYSLQINEEEEEMYKEEEQKRQKAVNQFQYSYDVPTDPAQELPANAPPPEEEDEEYTPAPSLDVPVDISIPKTVKENARIEKTALFVCKQGLQMEILLKAKQADNPQFGFLNQGHDLYKYYRHVLTAIKNGRYQITSNEEKSEESAENGASDEHYLHPSLVSAVAAPPEIPAVPYKPSANCSYSQLVNRIQGTNHADQLQSEKGSSGAPEMTEQQQQYYQYCYAAQYYEYYKQHAQYQGNGQGQSVQPPETTLDPNVQSYIQQMAYAQYMQNQPSSTNPYAQIVSNVNNKELSNPYSALLVNLQEQQKENAPAPASAPVPIEQETKTVTVIPKAEKKNILVALAEYGSSSSGEDASDSDSENSPSGETQIVIDKMASYVAKNGEQFEEIVKAKGDPRFEFLNPSHEYFKYYKTKLKEMKGKGSGEKVIEKGEVKTITVSPSCKKEKKQIAPVCFSIKKPKDEPAKEIKSALPVEESDEELQQPAEAQEETKSESNNEKIAEEEVKEMEIEGGVSDNSVESSVQQNNGVLDGDDPILEMIDLTDDAEERKDAKRAEDRIKDKLAAAAREKMVSVARDRALQLERKKKAAAFLKLKSAEENKHGEDAAKENSEETSKIVQIDIDSGEDEKKRKSRRKKSHKRKHSKSKHDSRSKKKSKKKRRRSDSDTNSSSS